MTKYSAEVTLLPVGGRKTGLSHSPFLCYLTFPGEEEAYSARVLFDSANPWNLGENRRCDIEFLHWENFPENLERRKFELRELGVFAEGLFD